MFFEKIKNADLRTFFADKNFFNFQILVATNGIAAFECILSMRKLLKQFFRNDRIIEFVCLTTEQEIQSKAVNYLNF
ncbi:unnamed protein product [Meloidogyne enterolobii]|uniref:Uncharacterized protein n=1 Tax=Meloidogyne enterolobii TaxID=390850 RepID=A0ACB1AKG9_MELEN